MILLYCQVISVCYHLTINIKQELYGVTKFYSPAILTSSSNKYIPTIRNYKTHIYKKSLYSIFKSYKSVHTHKTQITRMWQFLLHY